LHIFCDDLPFDVACSKQSPTQPNPPPPPEQQSQKSNSNKTLQTGNSSFDLVHHQCSHSASSHPLSGDEHSSQKTNKFSKSIENDEETSARTKCNPNLQPKGLRETGATNDKSDAKHTFASVKVKIEGEAPDSNRLKPAETNLGPSSLGNIYTRCLTADGHEFFNILDTSEEEECEKVTSNSNRRRTTPRVKSPQISGKRKSFEVQTTTNSEKSEEGPSNVKIRKVDLAEDAPLDGSLRHPPSKFHHPKHPKTPNEIAFQHPVLENDRSSRDKSFVREVANPRARTRGNGDTVHDDRAVDRFCPHLQELIQGGT